MDIFKEQIIEQQQQQKQWFSVNERKLHTYINASYTSVCTNSLKSRTF